MKKTSLFPVLMLLCLLFLQTAAAETRQGVIVLEGMEEPIEETHKYVVAMDKLAIGNDEGIAFVHIADFLLMDKW